ncbi:hypothetical protein Tco_0916354 [Tanacetum coccineum]
MTPLLLPSSRHNHRHHREPTATITPPSSSYHHHPVTPPPSPPKPHYQTTTRGFIYLSCRDVLSVIIGQPVHKRSLARDAKDALDCVLDCTVKDLWEESFGDDVDDEKEDEGEDEEEEEHLASAESIPSPQTGTCGARMTVRSQPPMAASTKALIAADAATLPLPSPPPSPLTSYSSPLP